MGEDNNAPISTGEWIITLILMMIPCVNIIMLFVWAFGNCNTNKKNFSRATLIITLVLIIVYIILLLVFGSVLTNLVKSTGSL